METGNNVCEQSRLELISNKPQPRRFFLTLNRKSREVLNCFIFLLMYSLELIHNWQPSLDVSRHLWQAVMFFLKLLTRPQLHTPSNRWWLMSHTQAHSQMWYSRTVRSPSPRRPSPLRLCQVSIINWNQWQTGHHPWFWLGFYPILSPCAGT